MPPPHRVTLRVPLSHRKGAELGDTTDTVFNKLGPTGDVAGWRVVTALVALLKKPFFGGVS